MFDHLILSTRAKKSINDTNRYRTKKVNKGVWRMPRLSEATKDVISCDKLRVAANKLLSGDFRMGQPIPMKSGYPY